jgi:hypothetical protein
MRQILSALLLSTATLAFGCVGSGTVEYSATVSTPDLVEVSPGVQVIADYDTPVFYSGGLYWRNDGGTWYSSSVYDSGWAFAASPPEVIIGIGEPDHYRHYRPSGYVARHRAAPQRPFHPVVRAETRGNVHGPVENVHPAEPRGNVHPAEPRGNVHPAEPRGNVHPAERGNVHPAPARPPEKKDHHS